MTSFFLDYRSMTITHARNKPNEHDLANSLQIVPILHNRTSILSTRALYQNRHQTLLPTKKFYRCQMRLREYLLRYCYLNNASHIAVFVRTYTVSMVISYVYAKNSAPRADRGFINDVQNTNSNCDITMWAGIYNFLMHRVVCFDWNYFPEDYKIQTYWSHGAPCSTRDLIPWMWKYIICMNDNREPNGHFS